jgi:hypothetical protein
VGDYDSKLNPHVFTGGLIHYEDTPFPSGYTYLLDFTPQTSAFTDSALTGTFNDPHTNITLSIVSATSSGLSVNLTYPPPPCVRAQPHVAISPANPTVTTGASVSYTVTVTNQDSTSCAASTLTLSSTNLSGWTTTFSSPSLTVDPGQSASATMTKTVAPGFTPGTYAVNATASDANHSATGAANCTVAAPVDPIEVVLGLGPKEVTAPGVVTIRATVTNLTSGVPITGATVTFRLTRPDGAQENFTASTSSNGKARWDYLAQQEGTYTVAAEASYFGQTDQAPPKTFIGN